MNRGNLRVNEHASAKYFILENGKRSVAFESAFLFIFISHYFEFCSILFSFFFRFGFRTIFAFLQSFVGQFNVHVILRF